MTLRERMLLWSIEWRLHEAERKALKLKALRERKRRGHTAVLEARYLGGSLGMQAARVREMIEEG